jgi:hypothetical protein
LQIFASPGRISPGWTRQSAAPPAGQPQSERQGFGSLEKLLIKTFEKIKALVESGEVRISEPGYDELINDDLTAREIIESIEEGILVEDYPSFPKGPAVLLLQTDRYGEPVHVVWGIPKGYDKPAVLVTAYRPDPDRWNAAFMERKK